MHSEVAGPDYAFVRMHAVDLDGYGGVFVSNLTAARSYDPHGLGSPVYGAFADSTFSITAARLPAGTKAYLTFVQTSQDISHHDIQYIMAKQ